MRETRQAIGDGAGVFLFTTLDQVLAGNVFTSPIWWRAGGDGPTALWGR
jgi:hypothetical protein